MIKLNIPHHANIFGVQGAATNLQEAAERLRDAREHLLREGAMPPAWLLLYAKECDDAVKQCEAFVLSTGLVTP